jgi:hypothetical protein
MFTSRNFKFKIPLNCTDGTTLPQYGIYKKQNTGTKLNKSISCAQNLLKNKKKKKIKSFVFSKYTCFLLLGML